MKHKCTSGLVRAKYSHENSVSSTTSFALSIPPQAISCPVVMKKKRKKKDARSFPKHVNALVVTQGSKHKKSQWFSWQRHSVPVSRSHKAQWTKRGHQIYKSTWRKQTRGGRKEGEKKIHGHIDVISHSLYLSKQLICDLIRGKLKVKKFQLMAGIKLFFLVWDTKQSHLTRSNSTHSGWR